MARKAIKEYMRYTISGLRFAGLYTEEDDIFKTRFYWSYTLIFSGILIGIMNVSQVINILLNLGNIGTANSSLYLSITFVMPSVKTYYYLRNYSLIRRLISKLDDETFQPKNERQAKNSESFFMYHDAIYLMYLCICPLLITGWMLIPLVSHSEDKKLMFDCWIPYDWKKPIVYELTYAYQAIAIFCMVVVNINMDMITFGFNSYISIECDILSDTLRHIYEFAEEDLEARGSLTLLSTREEREQKVMDGTYKILLDCIAHHKEIIPFAENANEFFNMLIFMQFASSMVSLCLTMFELTVVRSLLEGTVVALFQAALIIELFFYTFFGEEIITRSSRIADALYETTWVDASETFKKAILFFMVRTQRPIEMKALSFFVLSLPTCAAIYRAAWSFFVMLHQTQGKHY